MKSKLLLIILLLVSIGSTFAQTRRITGKVTSSEDGSAIPGATILVQGSTIGTVTTIDGSFTVNLPENAEVLVFSFVGMKSQEVLISSATEYNVSLEPDLIGVNEIIVTANAIQKEKRELGYAVTTVGGDEMTKTQESNVVNSLAGKVPGVRITNQSGEVGGSTRVLIRGINSFSGDNQPLFVIDGTPILNDSKEGQFNEYDSGFDTGNRASDINSDDIESVTVLKGGAAAALYGSRARDGAIIITTKRGSRKKEFFVSYSGTATINQPFILPDFQNEYGPGQAGKYDDEASNGWGPNLADVAGQTFTDFNGNEITLKAYPDNVKDFYQTGSVFSNTVDLANADETGDFRLGYTNLRQDGIVPESWLNRNTVTFNAGKNMGKFQPRATMSYIRSLSSGKSARGANNNNALTGTLYGLPRTFNPEEYKEYQAADGSQNKINDFINNPYWIVNKNVFSNEIDRVIGTAQLSYRPFTWMEILGRAGTDFYREWRRYTIAKGSVGNEEGQFSDEQFWSRQFNSDIMVNIEKEINDDLGLKVILGHNVNQRDYRRMSNESRDLIVEDLYDYGNAKTNTPDQYSETRRIWGVYTDITLTYKNFLFLNLTGRNDHSSTLPEDNSSYFYPSVSTSFIVTDAFPTLKSKILSYAKLRANWASVGSDEDPYQLDFVFNPDSEIFGQYGTSTTLPHGGYNAFAQVTTLPPTNLKPQKQNSMEIGADIYMFNHRLGIDFAYYESITKDQIVRVPVPYSTGFVRQKMNVGEISNKGIELRVTGTPLQTKNFKWDLTFNFSKGTTVVEKIAEGVERITFGSTYSSIEVAGYEGEERQLIGVGFKRDPDGNKIINPETGLFAFTTEAIKLGKVDPDWTGGVSSTIKYKNLSLSALVDMQFGAKMFSNTVQDLRRSGLAKETSGDRSQSIIAKGVNEITDADGNVSYVTNTTPISNIERYWRNYSTGTTAENAVFDSDYVKLREVRLNYSFPKNIVAKTPFGSIDLALQGRNLLLIHSKIPHIDPETGILGSSSAPGIEWGGAPATRNIGFNIRLTL